MTFLTLAAPDQATSTIGRERWPRGHTPMSRSLLAHNQTFSRNLRTEMTGEQGGFSAGPHRNTSPRAGVESSFITAGRRHTRPVPSKDVVLLRGLNPPHCSRETSAFHPHLSPPIFLSEVEYFVFCLFVCFFVFFLGKD